MTSHVQSQDHLSEIGSKSSKLKASQNHLQHIASSHPSNPFKSHLKALLLKIFYCFFAANSETAGNCSCNTSRFQDRRHGWCRSNATKNHLPGATLGRFGCRTSRALMDLDGLWMHIGPIECRMYVAEWCNSSIVQEPVRKCGRIIPFQYQWCCRCFRLSKLNLWLLKSLNICQYSETFGTSTPATAQLRSKDPTFCVERTQSMTNVSGGLKVLKANWCFWFFHSTALCFASATKRATSRATKAALPGWHATASACLLGGETNALQHRKAGYSNGSWGGQSRSSKLIPCFTNSSCRVRFRASALSFSDLCATFRLHPTHPTLIG